ncbi:MAG: hypothetical protein MUF83_12560 [Acidimicrobiales bacterium]|jgi:hypothetical protein|nr:hypothetical protein [Acidimicrobiales bacterium]
MPDDHAAHEPDPAAEAPTMTWLEEETLTTLRRLANARARLAELEARIVSTVPDEVPIDPADLELARELHEEIESLRPRAAHRLAGRVARNRLEGVELHLRLVLDRLGYATYDDFVEAGRRPAVTAPDVDPVALEFARRELASAEHAWAEVQALGLADLARTGDGVGVGDGEDASPGSFQRPPAASA